MSDQSPQPWLARELTDDLERQDAGRVARSLGAIIANNDRVRDAIQRGIEADADAVAILNAVSTVMLEVPDPTGDGGGAKAAT